MNRREFLETGIKSVLGTSLMSNMALAAKIETGGSDKLGAILPTRPLAKTGEQLTLLGVGGYHVGLVDERSAHNVIEAALEEGVRFFDTAHGYANGRAEERYGYFLCPKYREQVFLMTKSTAKSATSFQEEFDISLKRLKTDYVDLLYIHSLGSLEDVDARQNGGVFDKVRELQAKGLVRHLGFSCHTHMTVAHYFLGKIKDDIFVNCCQTPVNTVDAGSPGNSFTTQVIPRVIDMGLSHIAMKSLAGGALTGRKLASRDVGVERYPIPGDITLEENFHFVLSQPITAWVSGMETPDEVRQNAKIARQFVGLSDQDKSDIVTKVAAQQYDRDTRTEIYKTVL
jgi:uncharacterized protein